MSPHATMRNAVNAAALEILAPVRHLLPDGWELGEVMSDYGNVTIPVLWRGDVLASIEPGDDRDGSTVYVGDPDDRDEWAAVHDAPTLLAAMTAAVASPEWARVTA